MLKGPRELLSKLPPINRAGICSFLVIGALLFSLLGLPALHHRLHHQLGLENNHSVPIGPSPQPAIGQPVHHDQRACPLCHPMVSQPRMAITCPQVAFHLADAPDCVLIDIRCALAQGNLGLPGKRAPPA